MFLTVVVPCRAGKNCRYCRLSPRAQVLPGNVPRNGAFRNDVAREKRNITDILFRHKNIGTCYLDIRT